MKNLRSFLRPVATLFAICASLLVFKTNAQAVSTTITLDAVRVVQGSVGQVIQLDSENIPTDYVGGICAITVTGTNNSSIHPNNDLLVTSGTTTLTASDVEASNAPDFHDLGTLVAGNTISVSLRLGAHAVYSGGFTINAVCEPVIKGSIGDLVWLDLNSNGIKDENESGIASVRVRLLSESGAELASTLTNQNGLYTFTNLDLATYRVSIDTTTLPSNVQQTYDHDGVQSAHTSMVTLTSSVSDRTDQDFGYVLPVVPEKGSIGNRVWFDADKDGVQDNGEDGIENVIVRLTTPQGTILETVVTDENGEYIFDQLDAGNYCVVIVPSSLPNGLVQTFDADGLATQSSSCASLSEGQDRVDQDFGYGEPTPPPALGSIGDRVWYDANSNGVQNTGEVGIENVIVQLTNTQGSVLETTVTNSNGEYVFDELPADTYCIVVVYSSLPSGLMQTFDADGLGTVHQSCASLSAGQNRTDQDFGYVLPFVPEKGSIGDRVWYDLDKDGVQDAAEDGIENVIVRLTNAQGTVLETTVTDENGEYIFDELNAGNYCVVIVSSSLPNGLVQTFDADGLATQNSSCASLSEGQDRVDQDFGYGEIVVPRAAVSLEKTVYEGHNAGNSCSTSVDSLVTKVGAKLTYCFKITNTGDTYLRQLHLVDELLKLDTIVDVLLAPGESTIYNVETVYASPLVNTAIVIALPVDEEGMSIPNIDKPMDIDTAKTSSTITVTNGTSTPPQTPKVQKLENTGDYTLLSYIVGISTIIIVSLLGLKKQTI